MYPCAVSWVLVMIITKWSDKEKDVAREKIALYKEIRETVHKGDHYRLISPYEHNRSVLQFVNKPKSESVVFVYNLAEYPDNAIPETKRSKKVKLRGLEPDTSYRIEGMDGLYAGRPVNEYRSGISLVRSIQKPYI